MSIATFKMLAKSCITKNRRTNAYALGNPYRRASLLADRTVFQNSAHVGSHVDPWIIADHPQTQLARQIEQLVHRLAVTADRIPQRCGFQRFNRLQICIPSPTRTTLISSWWALHSSWKRKGDEGKAKR